MSRVRAIETQYKGYRMRSRLEARWAVFLDSAGIKWLYENESLEVQLARGQRSMWWLPDFELPELEQYVEVKGFLSKEEAARLLLLASGVSDCSEGKDVVVLGQVHEPNGARWATQLHFHRGLWAMPWDLMTGCPLLLNRPRMELKGSVSTDLLLGGVPAAPPIWAREPLIAARSARFEHGQYGAG